MTEPLKVPAKYSHFFRKHGQIPAKHWINSPKEGGGRIVGEVCHFVDLIQHLVGVWEIAQRTIKGQMNE